MIYPNKMNHRRRLTEIAAFLKPYQKIWQNEIMLMYPRPFEDYPWDWIEELAEIKDQESVIQLEKKNVAQLLRSPSLLNFYEQIEHLSRFDGLPSLAPMPVDRFTFLYIIPKKQYEIQKLAPFVKDFTEKYPVRSIVDIGGGVGFLAQTLVNQYNLQVTSLDMDEVLQKTGRERHAKNAKNPLNQVQFHQVKVQEDSPLLRNFLASDILTLGLHTCGTLAVDQIKASAKHGSSLINFGCCYYKMGKEAETQNISAFAKSLTEKIEMNPYALTLATRAHRKMSDKDFEFKLKVKFYRYAFHILLHDEYKMDDPMTLGNSSPKLYESDFHIYAEEQFRRINVPPRHSSTELDTFFKMPRIQEVIWQMLAAGLIRNALGRLLEVYLLLDRAIYLEEMGYEVQIREYFDEELSPRNLGISAHKKI